MLSRNMLVCLAKLIYTSFKTTHEGVEMNPDLVKGDGDELTIVLQHQYWDLKVEEAQLLGHFIFLRKARTTHYSLCCDYPIHRPLRWLFSAV